MEMTPEELEKIKDKIQFTTDCLNQVLSDWIAEELVSLLKGEDDLTERLIMKLNSGI